jgi:uncharacterized protein YegL
MQSLQKSTSQSLSQIGENILIETQTADYETRINRDRPACFVFLIDQSGSMKDNWGGDTSKSKAEMVALYVNNAMNELINACQKTEAEPRHYFDIAVIGYGQKSEEAQILWEGNLAGKTFVSPAELKQNPTGNNGEIEVVRRTFKGETKVKIPVVYWFSPVAASLTPMGSAFDKCTEILNDWTSQHANSFPPIVINITDGEQTDCQPDKLLEKAYQLRQTKTHYGKTLLFNVHISVSTEQSVVFPESMDELPQNKQSRLLYDMSSMLPMAFKQRIATEVKKTDLRESTEYVAMTFQASVSDMIKCLDIGTKTIKTN